ncbi:MAG: hypothetical protein LBN38_04840 [Verrucomicrobiota bacterium]|jgi:hypothetical protein|nr:hypothetical protein [Verrucomicrobiota bacterium]
MKKKIPWFGLACLVLGATMAQGDVLALWNTTQAEPLAGTYAPKEQHEFLSVGPLVVSPTLLRSGSGPAGNTFAAAGYSGSSAAEAQSLRHYWETTIEPGAACQVSFGSVRYRMRAPKSGPKISQWAYSTDGTTFIWLVPTNGVTDGYANEKTVDLSAIAALQNRSGKVWFRLYAWGGGTANSSWGVIGREDAVVFEGTAVSLNGPPAILFPMDEADVNVSNELTVAIRFLPDTSTLAEWELSPSASGSYRMSGNTFHFTPNAADEGKDFLLTAVASNPYGRGTNTLPITVLGYLPPGTYEMTFEDAEKNVYPDGEVSLNGRRWRMDQAMIGDSDDDRKMQTKAARFGYLYQATLTSQEKLLASGIQRISFLHAKYATDETGAALVVEIANDLALGDWMEVGTVMADSDELVEFETSVQINTPMYVRIRTRYEPGVGRVNVDNIRITPYQIPIHTPYEQFLLRFNVTPGDAGTAEGEDYDGDGWTNLQEFNASPQTNPYDRNRHP